MISATGLATSLASIEPTPMKARHGSAAYAMEELRAELASAFIAGELDIPTDIPQYASYIQSWLGPLKKDKREIFRAAADAQRIVDMVLGSHPDCATRQPKQRPQSEDLSREEITQKKAIAYHFPAATPG